MTASRRISVVVRTSNSEAALRRLVRRLKISPGDELIVVDTGSRDGTLAVAEAAGARVIRNPEAFHYSRTLNLGFAAARNDWVLALSSHCVPIVEDLLETYRTALAACDEPPAAMCGANALSRGQYARMAKLPLVEVCSPAGPPWAGNANCLYAREAWQRRPFDESLPTGEDMAWLQAALRDGWRCVRAPAAAVLYHHVGSPLYRFRKGYGEVRISAPNVVPMTLGQLGLGLAQATRRLLWEERSVASWLGQVAHQFGAFVASRQA